ncbi:Transcription factor 25 [Chytriomyces hyalinus]|nr:Transcription factor 25 [Chytriomyces hyalinus]
MSSRAARKILKERELAQLSSLNTNQSVSDSEEEPENYSVIRKKNAFDMVGIDFYFRVLVLPDHLIPTTFQLMASDNDEPQPEDEDQPSENETQERAEQAHVSHSTTTTKKKAKKKKAKKSAKQTVDSNEEQHGRDMDEIDRAIEEVQAQIGANALLGPSVSDNIPPAKKQRDILAVDLKLLDSGAELRKMFGSKVLALDAMAKKGKRNVQTDRLLAAMGYGGKSYLSSPKDTWPRMPSKTGISMNMLRAPSKMSEEPSPGYFEFAFSSAYMEIQMMFLHCVSTHDPNTLTNLIHAYPFHVDSLLQKSEIAKHNGDITSAAEYIERALFIFEKSFHPLFNMALANSILPYSFPQNRAFFLAISRHISFIARKGCWRTCLELSKLLLSLDPEDPLGALQMMDWYAVKAGERSWMRRCWTEWGGDQGQIAGLPNWSFSMALVEFEDESETKKPHDLSTQRLTSAIKQYPLFVPTILSKLTVTEPSVTSHPYFAAPVNPNSSESAIHLLIMLYVERCHHLWKEPSALLWLRETARALAAATETDATNNSSTVDVYPDGLPLNVSRHVYVSDFQSLVPLLPDEARALSLNAFDPMPPSAEDDSAEGGAGAGLTGLLGGGVGWMLDQLRNLMGAAGENDLDADANEDHESDEEDGENDGQDDGVVEDPNDD